jgi:hypothetical protein
MSLPARWLALALTLAGAPLLAQEWHESYRAGVRALAEGQPLRAVSLLEQAVSQRPQPGRNVITYGTNVEPRYYPYLRLAEAYLRLGDLRGARSAIERSARWGIEPQAERARLAAQLEEAVARAAPPAPTLAPVPAPTPTPAPPAAPSPSPTPPVALPPPETPLVRAPPATPTPPPRREAETPRRPTTAPPAAPEGHPERAGPGHPGPAGATGVLEIVSQPPGAAVYLDDERLGTTDAEWGRLVATVAAGRHRLRLSFDGHRGVAEEVEVAAGGTTAIRRRLPPASARFDARVALAAGVVLALIGLTAWALRRPRGVADLPTPRRAGGGSTTPGRGTPAGVGPGVVRGEDGADYFGEYRLLEPLGRGGMASVHKVERRGELYALKRPLPAFLQEPEFLERFLREAEIGRALHHPNIVRILERGEVEGVPYFTMELIAGETLQARLQRGGALDPRAAAGLVAQVAEALDYAHLKGVVHRDLKPSNIMVLADGTARVMDYGIARTRRFEGLTVTGAFLGSPEYVAPEAIEGKPTDARGDLYSLGVVFYEALTGRRPFAAETPFAILRKHLTETPPPPSAVTPGIPAELERIVLRLLSKRPEDRYPGADELVLELRDFLNRAA